MDFNFNDFNASLHLTMEQEFKMRVFEESVQSINREEAQSLLLEASRMLMVKDNIIKNFSIKG